jgi:preprotein translocase subunit YajC
MSQGDPVFDHFPLTLGQADVEGVGSGAANQPTIQSTQQPIDGAGDGPGGDRPATPAGPNFMNMMLLIVLFMAVMMIFTGRANKKEKKKRAEMIAQLKKGSRVQTIGGIIGSVVEVRENEVVVKVDENANTRIKFARSAVQSVLDDKDE